MGPAGFVSIDDSGDNEILSERCGSYPEGAGVMEMGGRDWKDEQHMVTESVIRAFYAYYRQVMNFNTLLMISKTTRSERSFFYS